MGQQQHYASSDHGQLTIVAGAQKIGTTVKVDPLGDTTIGSQPGCTLVIPSKRVALVHCRIRHEHGAWVLRCATDTQKGARYHVIVNDRRCSDIDLNDGDRIEAGGYRIRFDGPQEADDGTDDMDALVLDLEPLEDVLDPEYATPKKIPDNMPSITLKICEGKEVPEPQITALPGESILIGSSDTVLWRLMDRTASRHHCRVETNGDQWIVRDLQSRNGTFVDALRVSTANLVHGSRLAIGRYQIDVTINT